MFFWFFPATVCKLHFFPDHPKRNIARCRLESHYWHFQFKAETAPLVLWLQGGPGGSSLFGLFVEHGPFSVTKSLELEPRSTAWTLTHNVIYIDNPVGECL